MPDVSFCFGECKEQRTNLEDVYFNTVPDPTRGGFPYIVLHDLARCTAYPKRIEGYVTA